MHHRDLGSSRQVPKVQEGTLCTGGIPCIPCISGIRTLHASIVTEMPPLASLHNDVRTGKRAH
ncbi:unnamed protein product [Dracunculus medinensis]|uniref:Uncharacterized protein n=1 Tax=Dracunculus medinensis TaxID=318479 RepID=A0A0N4URQ3_DRAME|nr:unnamed protein product [Dracunculus medinensis]